MSPWSGKRGEKSPKQVHVPAHSQLSGNNSATASTPTESVQKSSKKREILNSVTSFFGSTSGRSTRAPTPVLPPSPAAFTENDTSTEMHATSTPAAPSQTTLPHEERDPESSGTIVKALKNASRGPLKLGELLQQEASELWTKAYNELPAKYKQDLGCMGNTIDNDDRPEKLEALKQLLERAMEAKRENIARQWKLKWGSKEINVREKAEKLVGWIVKFKAVVDIAVQYDPVHAALPWAGIRLILILVIGEQQNLQHAIIAMERIAFLVGRCTIYEKLYLTECEGINIPDIAKTATDELRRALVVLYAAILRALSQCMRVFKGMLYTYSRILKGC